MQVKLLDAFQNGIVVHIRLNADEHKSPPAGKRWLILSGLVSHINLTADVLSINTDKNVPYADRHQTTVFYAAIGPTIATGKYPLFNLTPSEWTAQYPPLLVIVSDWDVFFDSTADAYCNLAVLEW